MRSLKAPNVISFALLKTTFFILMAGFCGLHHPAPSPEKPVVGQHAPSLGVENWLRGQSGISRDPSLAFWAGRVVIVQIHTGEEGGPLVSLMSEIGVAGADRLLRRVALAPVGILKAWKLEELGLDYPTGEVAEDSPWYTPEAPIWIIGRAGEVRWHGDPITDERGFLEELDLALGLPRGPRLRRAPGPELAEAAGALWQADWKKARSLAEKVQRKHARARDEQLLEVSERAGQLVAAIDAHADDLLAEARGAVGADKAVVYWRARRALEQGFPRSAQARAARELEREAMQSERVLLFSDAEKYLDKLEPGRPVLFPARRTREGDAFAKDLEKFVKGSDNRAGIVLVALEMLEHYRELP